MASDDTRESAAFDILIPDYRRAFELALSTWTAVMPSFGTLFMARLRVRRRDVVTLLVLPCVVIAALYMRYTYQVRDAIDAPWFFVRIVLVMIVIFVLVALQGARNDRSYWRRFARERTAWKRPRRLRLRWSDAGLMQLGEDGFASFGWNTIFCWIDAPTELVIFTAALDPVPVPHAALREGDLDDLRRRLHAAGAPQEWSPENANTQGLRQTFN